MARRRSRRFGIAFTDHENKVGLGLTFEARSWVGAMWAFFWALVRTYRLQKKFEKEGIIPIRRPFTRHGQGNDGEDDEDHG